MILNSSETKIVASCGWVDKSSLLVIDTRDHQEKRFKIGEAQYIVLKKLPKDYFIVIQYFSGEYVILSIHSFADPTSKLTEVIVTSKHLEFKGDQGLWKLAPKYYVAYLNDQFQGNDYRLIEINLERKDELFPNLEWFDDSYDKGYQGVMDVVEIPNTNYLLFSVQRSSAPVLYDISNKKVVSKIKLAGRAGNPVFTFRNNQRELWCVDYDTLIRMRIPDWRILVKRRLQGPSLQAVMQFIGDFSFTADEKYCAVARPFSRDTILIECDTFKIVAKRRSHFQPINTVVLSNLDFAVRDWQTGKVEFGLFKIKKGIWPFN